MAAYFALIGDGPAQTKNRVVWALAADAVLKKSSLVTESHTGEARPPIIEQVRPLSDDNPRLVNQDGLFTRGPDGVDVEAWVRKNFAGVRSEYVLIKLLIPNKDRIASLRSLNRMNINHLTLFPDLYGASKFCNLDLEVKNY